MPNKQTAEDLVLESLNIHLESSMTGAGDVKADPTRKKQSLSGLGRSSARYEGYIGGYSREEANLRLAQNKNMIASFSEL